MDIQPSAPLSLTGLSRALFCPTRISAEAGRSWVSWLMTPSLPTSMRRRIGYGRLEMCQAGRVQAQLHLARGRGVIAQRQRVAVRKSPAGLVLAFAEMHVEVVNAVHGHGIADDTDVVYVYTQAFAGVR